MLSLPHRSPFGLGRFLSPFPLNMCTYEDAKSLCTWKSKNRLKILSFKSCSVCYLKTEFCQLRHNEWSESPRVSPYPNFWALRSQDHIITPPIFFVGSRDEFMSSWWHGSTFIGGTISSALDVFASRWVTVKRLSSYFIRTEKGRTDKNWQNSFS